MEKKQKTLCGMSIPVRDRKHKGPRKRNLDGIYKALLSFEYCSNTKGMQNTSGDLPSSILMRLEHENFYREIPIDVFASANLHSFNSILGKMFGKPVLRMFIVRPEQNGKEIRILVNDRNLSQIFQTKHVKLHIEFECSYIG